MTEKEARQKWCPIAHPETARVNRSSFCPCIASDCMAWRNGEPVTDWETQGASIEYPNGYCGLAGK